MKKLILAFILTGCGEPFSTTLFHAADAPDAGDVVDAPQATGGAPSSGGAASTGGSGTGGHVVSAGGASTGGAVSSTGGAPQATTGGSPSTGGSDVGDAGCAPVTHDNGLGQTWQDCVPSGTYDTSQAKKACEAWCDTNGCAGACFTASFCGVEYMTGQSGSGVSTVMTGWAWKAPHAGNVADIDPITQVSCVPSGTWR